MHGFAGYGFRGPQMMEYGHGGLGFIGPLVLLALGAVMVAVLVWALTRHRTHTSAGAAAGMTAPPALSSVTPAARTVEDDALRITRERLARGEITVEEYTVIAEALRG